ncbi:MAG: DUF262 domain-containing protein [Chloroflexi bacterium]|nr:DUF262 domain-containing protein [Chloroflexota bacterium]
MRASHQDLWKLLEGSKQFVVPIFQRNYNWTEEQCVQLWNDVLQAADAPANGGHFLGSIVYTAAGPQEATFSRWLVIDGQQRLTTLSLLLAALRDHIQDSGWAGEGGPTSAEIDSRFLQNAFKTGDQKPRLVLRRNDDRTLRKIVEGSQESIDDPASEVDDAYQLFRGVIASSDPAEIYKGLGNLKIVDVMLEPPLDNPQLVFESLNSTGVDLSQADLIRNFILMGLPEEEQNRIYCSYWRLIESEFEGSHWAIDNCARDWVALRRKATRQIRTDRIYVEFREEYRRLTAGGESVDAVLADLLQFSKGYAAFVLRRGPGKDLGAALGELRRHVDVPAMLVARLFRCYHDLRTLNESEFAESIRLIESYIVRRQVCGLQTRGYWSVFANIAYGLDEDCPSKSLEMLLARRQASYRFPSDEEFERALFEDNLYGARVCRPLLEGLENAGHLERVDTDRFQIEHVMPQVLSEPWKQMLGERWEEIHQTWLHRLGNLTLTAYNPLYSNRGFQEKKVIPGGFEDSAVRLNKFISKQDKWTAQQMSNRGKMLAARALGIWCHHGIAEDQIARIEFEELRNKAKASDPDSVEMTDLVRNLFQRFRERLQEIDREIIELAARKSVSYFGPAFAFEVLPRKTRLLLLLAPEFHEIDDPSGLATKNTYKFLVNCQNEGGVLFDLDREERIAPAIGLVRQALNLADAE